MWYEQIKFIYERLMHVFCQNERKESGSTFCFFFLLVWRLELTHPLTRPYPLSTELQLGGI